MSVSSVMADPAPRFADLGEAADWYRAWLLEAALPLWWTKTVDRGLGGFLEALTPQGEPVIAPRRARVQARQAYVFATSAAIGWPGPSREAAWHGLEFLLTRYARAPGVIARTLSVDGEQIDTVYGLYEHAFALFAMAAVYRTDPARRELAARAVEFRQALDGVRHAGGFLEPFGGKPHQSNSPMHLLEAALAWEETGEPGWAELADEIAALALNSYIDPANGVLYEYFDASWRPAPGDDGRFFEPGHQFEWGWLLERWGRARGRSDARAAARRLYELGLVGFDPVRGVTINALWEDLSVRSAVARFWPQTEWLKAALIFADERQALAACHGLALYLATPARGAYYDNIAPDGTYLPENAPATSLYHIVCACLELFRATGRL